jgi:hypothetical protein
MRGAPNSPPETAGWTSGFAAEIQEAILEIKGFLDWNERRRSRRQAAAYARQMEMEGVTLAVFPASKDPHVLETLSTTETLDGTTVTTVAIGGFD